MADTTWHGVVGIGGGYYIFGGEVGMIAHNNLGWPSGLETTALLTIGHIGIFVRRNWNFDQASSTEFGLRLNVPIIPFLYPFVSK